MKNRVAIYQREATEMLQNIAQYPGLTEEQLCRFFPEKESTAKILLSHMLKEGRAYRADNGRYYINQEIQNGADDTLSRCIWVLLDFIEQVEYHTAGEFPVEVLCFANGQLYEIVPIRAAKKPCYVSCCAYHKKMLESALWWWMMQNKSMRWIFHIPPDFVPLQRTEPSVIIARRQAFEFRYALKPYSHGPAGIDRCT